MRIKGIRPAPSDEVWDLKVCDYANFAIATSDPNRSLVVHNCDTTCLGKACGTCDAEDLKKRRQYIVESQSEVDIELTRVRSVDQKSMVIKIRARIFKPEKYRFVMNDHWHFNVRRAAFRAAVVVQAAHCLAPVVTPESGVSVPCRSCAPCLAVGGISKRSIKFASDGLIYKDWTAGIDYIEFGMTRRLTPAMVGEFIAAMNAELCAIPGDESSRWLEIRKWVLHPANSFGMRTDVDLSLWELALDDDPVKVVGKLAAWEAATYVKMVLKTEVAYFNAGAVEVNGKEYVDGLWLARDGAKLMLRMLIRGRPSPYNVYAALMGRSSWIEAASNTAVRVEAFVETDRAQSDFFRLNCVSCGLQIQTNILDEPYDPDYCVRCLDTATGKAVTGLSLV